jgi:hypothetical protein
MLSKNAEMMERRARLHMGFMAQNYLVRTPFMTSLASSGSLPW